MSSSQTVAKFGNEYPGKSAKQIKGYIATKLISVASENVTSRKLNNFMTSAKSSDILGVMNRTTQKHIVNIMKKVNKKEGKDFTNKVSYKPRGSKIEPIQMQIRTAFDRHKIAVDSYSAFKNAMNTLASSKGDKDRLMSARGSLGMVVNNEDILPLESSKLLNIAKTIKQGIEGISPFAVSKQGNIRLNDPAYLKRLKDNTNTDSLLEDLYGTEINTAETLFSEYAGKDVKISDSTRRKADNLIKDMTEEQKAYLGLLCRQNMYLFYEDDNNHLEDGDSNLTFDGRLTQSKIMELVHKAKNASIERIVL